MNNKISTIINHKFNIDINDLVFQDFEIKPIKKKENIIHIFKKKNIGNKTNRLF